VITLEGRYGPGLPDRLFSELVKLTGTHARAGVNLK
jgi:hypothetical protein